MGCSGARRGATVFWFVMYNSYGFRLPGNTCVSVSARYTHTFRRRQTRAARGGGEGGAERGWRGMRVTVLNNPQTKMRCYFPFLLLFSLPLLQLVRLSGCLSGRGSRAGEGGGVRQEWGEYTEINK